MTRVRIIVEGQTEESFVSDVLAPSFWPGQVYMAATQIGVPGHQGGRVNYSRVRKDILLQLKQDPTTYCSTMFDLFGIKGAFPGMPLAPTLDGVRKAEKLEQGILEDITGEFPDLRADVRLIPYFQVHEYEGLLFSDTQAFAQAIRRIDLSAPLGEIRQLFPTPEHINDHPDTSPSHRIAALYPAYQKVIEGTIAARAVGLSRMRRECSHFDHWLRRIEELRPL